MKKIIFTYCCLIFFVSQARSQLPEYHVQLIKHNSLSSPGEIIQIMKDNNGFLWLRFPSKLQRFDGKNFRTFSFDERTIGIEQDEKGTIWLATEEALFRYKNDYTGFEKLKNNTVNGAPYRALLQGPGKKLYLSAANGILRWNHDTGKFEPFGIAPFRNDGDFPFLKSIENWLIYKGSKTALNRYNVETGQHDSVKVKDGNFLLPVNADSMWVREGIGSSSLISFKSKKINTISAGQFDIKFNDNRLFITGGFYDKLHHEYFISLNDKGYFFYNDVTNRFQKVDLFYNGVLLSGTQPVYNFYQENNGMVWFANEGGLVSFNPYIQPLGLLRSNNSSGNAKWNNDIRNITEDDSGNIWFATANGFCKWNKMTGQVSTWLPKFEATDYLNYPSVRSIGFCDNKLIIGQSEKGFWIFDPARQQFKRPLFENDSLKTVFLNDFNNNMKKLGNGNFIATSQKIWLIEKETFRVHEIKFSGSQGRFRVVYEDAQERIWFAGSGGVFAVNSDFEVLFNLPKNSLGRWANSIVQIDENTFWIGSKKLYELKLNAGNQFSLKPLFTELKDVHFTNLFKDSLQHIWMSSDIGMYRYIPEKKLLEKFDQADNMQPFYVGVSNYFRGRDGTVYFGSRNGINYFIPEKIPVQNDSLQMQLVNVTVNQDDSSFLLHRYLPGLKSHQNSFVFDFIAPYVFNAQKVQYRCRLEGTDKDWVALGNSISVRYTSLRPGKYSFYVAASLNGTDWFVTSTPFSFKINPPFWQRWWFISLLTIAVTGGIYYYIKRREKIILEKEKQKTEIQKLKAGNYQYQLEMEQVTGFFGATIHQHDDTGKLLWDVAKNLIGKLGFEDCMIYLWNEDKTILLQKAGYGIKGSMQNDINKDIYHVPKGKGIVGAAVENRHYILANDTTLDNRYYSADGKVQLSELCVPIIHNNEAIGAINTEYSAKDFYTDRHLQILTTIASMLADKIEMIGAQQQTREKEIELLKLNKDLATSQLTALRTQMNPHFIFNALNSVQQYILQGNVVEANKYLSKFSKLQREILHYSNYNFISLEKEIEILNSYLQLEQLRFGESFTYAIQTTEEIDPGEIKIPPMMLQPFVENAIWHGLMPKQGERNLKIRFELFTDDILLATIRDNGIGRDASAKLKQNNGGNKSQHESKGMSLVNLRMHLLQQQYNKPFDVSVSDITDENRLVSGTEVSLKIFIGDK